VRSKALLYSRTAKSHIAPEFQAQIAEGVPPKKDGGVKGSWVNKSDALKKGWMSGRTGSYGGDWFAFIYTEQLSTLPREVGETLLKTLGEKVGGCIRYLTDPAGNILFENYSGNTIDINFAVKCEVRKRREPVR